MNAPTDPQFLDWLVRWEANLPPLDWDSLCDHPIRIAIVAVDMIKGFCNKGTLASPRAASIVPAVVDLFKEAYSRGVLDFLLLQDSHDEFALEFKAYPPHCIAGTEESETIDELSNLPFSRLFTVLPKNSISASFGTGLYAWLERHPLADKFIVVGVCTDICVYQAATYLRVRGNVRKDPGVQVVVPASCVQTYDLPVEEAEKVGAMPHDGDLLHRLALYHMALNGIEVVR